MPLNYREVATPSHFTELKEKISARMYKFKIVLNQEIISVSHKPAYYTFILKVRKFSINFRLK